MGSFMTLLCRSVYNVQCHIYEGIHSLTEQGCSDSDRDINAAILNAKGDSLRRRWEGNFAGASAPLVLNVLLDHL